MHETFLLANIVMYAVTM